MGSGRAAVPPILNASTRLRFAESVPRLLPSPAVIGNAPPQPATTATY
jgi:hypothetical protein